MKKTIILLFTSLLFLTSCSTYKKTVHTMDDSSKPSWVKKVNSPIWESNGKIYSVSIAEVDHDSNFSSAKRVSDNFARAQLAKMISNKLTLTETITEKNLKSKNYSLISSENLDLLLSDMVVEKNWFELVEVDNLDKTKRKEMHVYSLVSISLEKFKELSLNNKEERGVSSED